MPLQVANPAKPEQVPMREQAPVRDQAPVPEQVAVLLRAQSGSPDSGPTCPMCLASRIRPW